MTSLREPEGEKVTIVIPNWNGMQWLDGCLKSLQNQDLRFFKTIVVDNGSTDESVSFIRTHYPQVEIIALARNMGFAVAANTGIQRSTTPYVALLNNDTVVYHDWLSNLLQKLESSPPDIAAINAMMLRMEDSTLVDDAGDELSWYGLATKRGYNEPASAYGDEAEVFSPSAGASLYRREFLLKTGGFDPTFFAYWEDVDLGLRGRLLGYRYLYHPAAKVLHKSHGSGIHPAHHVKLVARNRLLLFAKNIPSSLLFKHALTLLYGQVYFFIAHAKYPLAQMQGYGSFFLKLPEAMKKRKQHMKDMMIDCAELGSIIHSRTPEPPLLILIAFQVKGLARRLNLLK